MKLTFQMNADDYAYGWKQKNKFAKKMSWLKIILNSIFVALIIIFSIYTKMYYGFSLVLIFLFPFFNRIMENRFRKTEFAQSVLVNGENTVVINEKDMEIFTAFQRYSVPFDCIFKVLDNSKYLVIMPNFSTNVFTINKENVPETALFEIVKILKEKLPKSVFKEGR